MTTGLDAQIRAAEDELRAAHAAAAAFHRLPDAVTKARLPLRRSISRRIETAGRELARLRRQKQAAQDAAALKTIGVKL
jgi:hypothetical protein